MVGIGQILSQINETWILGFMGALRKAELSHSLRMCEMAIRRRNLQLPGIVSFPWVKIEEKVNQTNSRGRRGREREKWREREREMKIIFESPDLIWPNLLLKSPPDSSTLQFWESIHASSFCSQFALNSETHDANWHVYQRLPLSPSLPPFVCTFQI